jgi:hypothetical protein
MGNVCITPENLKKTEIVFKPDTYRDVSLRRYTSSNDDYFDSFERKHNLLRCVQLSEFTFLFNMYTFDHSAMKHSEVRLKKRMFLEDLEKPEFISFIKTKIINHPASYVLKEENNSKQIFLDYLTKIYETVGKGYVSYIRNNNKAGKPAINDKKQKKYFLLAYGFLMCHSDNMGRINYLFEAFSNDNNKIEATLNFEIFLYVLILIASYAGISSFLEIAKTYTSQVPSVSQKDLLKTLEVYEVNDILFLKDKFVELFFGLGGSLSYIEYKQKLLEEGFDWILTGSGIRRKLEDRDKPLESPKGQ